MYCGMSPSRSCSACESAAFPPVSPLNSLSWVPPSSAYCRQRSSSTCSRACRNLRIAMSPLVIGARSTLSSRPNASVLPASSPAPTVAAPATVPFFRNERLLVPLLNACHIFVIELSSLRFEYDRAAETTVVTSAEAFYRVRWEKIAGNKSAERQVSIHVQTTRSKRLTRRGQSTTIGPAADPASDRASR